jgi:hypothetical protein
MAVSFTGEYLFQGTNYLRRAPSDEEHTSCWEGLLIVGRGAYSLGIMVVAPAGMIYHVCMATHCMFRQWCGAGDPIALREYMWQHLDAARLDLVAFGLTTYTLMAIGCIIAALVFQFPLLLLPPALFALHGYLFDIHYHAYMIPYIYAVEPLPTLAAFFSQRSDENDDLSQLDLLRGRAFVTNLIRGGEASDGPISEDEARAWIMGYNIISSPQASPVDKMLVIPTLLVEQNRSPTPGHRRLYATLVRARGHLENAWEASVEEHRDTPLDRDAIKQTFRNKCQEISRLGPQLVECLNAVWERI